MQAVVFNPQGAADRYGDEVMKLSRNCQLPEGEHAVMQAKRQHVERRRGTGWGAEK